MANQEEPEELAGAEERSPVTLALIITNVVVGLVMAFEGVPVLLATPDDLIHFGAVDPTRIWNGEIWRLFSACFVHVGAWHLGLNLWVLWQVGVFYERLVGSSRLLLVYLVSGVFGFALSLAFAPSLTAGASGAIFGLTGGLLSIARIARHKPLGRFLFTALLPFVVATFALGLLVPMVNNLAHFGGLLMGYLLGYGLCAGDDTFSLVERGQALGVPPLRRLLGRVSLVAAVALFAGLSFYAGRPALSPHFHAVMGLQGLHTVQLRDLPKDDPLTAASRAHLDAAVRLAPRDAATLLLQARMAEVDGDQQRAEQLTAEALEALPGEDRTARIDRAALELGLIRSAVDATFTDGFTMRTLCRAALAGDARTIKAPLLKNQCAWLAITAAETVVRDPALGLELAREARDEVGDGAEADAILHTWACALAETGNAAEGVAVLEKMEVLGQTTRLGRPFIEQERRRLQKLAEAQAEGRWCPVGAACPPAAAPPTSAPATSAPATGSTTATTTGPPAPDAATPDAAPAGAVPADDLATP